MEMLRIMRRTSVLLTLLLLAQMSVVLASGLLQYRSICGNYEIRYPDDSDHRLFHMNGGSLDQFIFCRAFRFYFTKLCFIEGYVRYHFCGSDIPLGRKLLQKPVREEGSTGNESIQRTQMIREESAHSTLLTTKNLAMAVVPVMFVLCCTLLCPCFHARKKGNDQTVLVKEPSSMDSVSSIEISSVPEKVPASPLRVPPSLLRVPPSPLRVPPSPRFSMSPQLDRNGSVHLDVIQVAKATRNFSRSLVIGEGGFGIVYKAQLPDGRVVAIKRAKKGQFHAIRTEFRSEVELLSKIDHRNLVKLLGYIDKGNERLVITEYVANGTLREHLDGMRGIILDFKQRLEISIDVAHGLTYLHMYAANEGSPLFATYRGHTLGEMLFLPEKQIIHRDVKSSNILLTESMRAKVADFGFARLGDADSEKTHISTKVKGTVGYLDPEYMRTYHLTPKSDVYSFGVLLLEILTGRRPVELKRPAEERVTLRWAFRKYDEGNIDELLDPLMNEAVDQQILVKIFGLAIQCAAPIRADRPDMKSVGEQLWGIRMSYLRSGTSE